MKCVCLHSTRLLSKVLQGLNRNAIGFLLKRCSLQLLETYQVKIYPVERHAIVKDRHLNRVILGYGNLTPEAIAVGVNRLKSGLRSP